ncbi:MAG: FecR family protein [Sphingomonas sp.]|uniref:FecR family protein n=1 Tax=Sphingomonas sp. TaxID=28214 RepID=UPI0035690028
MSPVEAAAHWLVRRDAHELSPSEEAEFDAWRADPVNADAYRRASGAMGLFDSDLGADPHLKALRQAALDAAPAPRRRFQAVAALMAASLVGAITLVTIERSGTGPVVPATRPATVAQAPVTPVVQPVRGTPTDYATGVGERRTVKLADGSTVTLNTRTRLTIAFTDGRRLVRLLRGQALFEVFHDRTRPFVVEAADRQVTALGTIFEVRVDPGRVNVVLIEGRVVVDRTPEAARAFESAPLAPTLLKPGEEFSVALGAPQRVGSVDVDRQLLWRDGFVEFDDEPLGAAVAEINRYSSRPITLGDDGVASLHLSGVFSTGAPDRFVDAVGAILPIESKTTPQGGIELSLSSRAPK